MANSTFDLTGKAVLVTGGNGGIGIGMAEEMAKCGADICIWGENAYGTHTLGIGRYPGSRRNGWFDFSGPARRSPAVRRAGGGGLG